MNEIDEEVDYKEKHNIPMTITYPNSNEYDYLIIVGNIFPKKGPYDFLAYHISANAYVIGIGDNAKTTVDNEYPPVINRRKKCQLSIDGFRRSILKEVIVPHTGGSNTDLFGHFHDALLNHSVLYISPCCQTHGAGRNKSSYNYDYEDSESEDL